ncbi:MotA/TolQ/ExbB proton channel family protein [Ketobacter nezhaii]|uniref:MotA/TolQ/ExbB proton channel family protein n=1 Tax=Ketobacter sp. MCCC 1A13808 TaxID=2602738 RepID=UPI0018DB7E02|nr:MotA/TolQ/ExbB proton channel family protein [Ketobacter sp. MCCC 1A13808]
MSMEWVSAIGDFAEQGGATIWVLLVVCMLQWALIVERILFYGFTFRRRELALLTAWRERCDHHSWRARKIRDQLVAQAGMELRSALPLLKTLIALCPLLGLLGTVTGMVSVFDVIAVTGTSDAQAMAQGVYRATIPTMAGLVVAISGIYFAAQLQRWADLRIARFNDGLSFSAEAK